jgi:type III restriction enzyme
MKQLKEFQAKAVDKICNLANMALTGRIDKKTVVFKSPTGSGKTFMMSQAIKRITEDSDFADFDLCFLWVSIGKGDLEKQSANSLKTEFDGYPKISLLENEFVGSRNEIGKNEILIFNWEKLYSKYNKDDDKGHKKGEWKNIFMKDGEKSNFRDWLIGTQNSERKIILIIDESHAVANSERAKELRDEIIKPNLTIEMSATPIFGEADVLVEPHDVINEELIKKEILINPQIGKLQNDENDSEQIILKAGFGKRMELAKFYEDNGIEVNPLCLIQLPNAEDGSKKREITEIFLTQNGVPKEKIAVWLSEEKFLTENTILTKNNSEVDFLIFKQAIDTGWDCPRAQILVKFRESQSITFEVQVLGRILRMPEAVHYENEELNKAFVYTNTKSIDVKKEEYNPNIIKTFYARIKDEFESPKLKSFYKHRISYNDITAAFKNVFEDKFVNYFNLKKGEFGLYENNLNKLKEWKIKKEDGTDMKLNVDNLKNKIQIISDGQISGEHIDSTKQIKAGMQDVKISENDKNMLIREIFESCLGSFQKARSLPVMMNVVYGTLENYLSADIAWIECFMLSNGEAVIKLLRESVETYSKYTKPEEERKKSDSIGTGWDDEWRIPSDKNYNPHEHELIDNHKKYFYDKCYLKKNRSNPEMEFEKWLEEQEGTEWWWKNGDEYSQENFGIEVISAEGISTFQPDFIVKYKDGNIGIYDTKSPDFQERDTQQKKNALKNYIENEKRKSLKLKGGIVYFDEKNGYLNI